MVAQVEEGPDFVLYEFGLYFAEHGVELFVAEDEYVVFGEGALG